MKLLVSLALMLLLACAAAAQQKDKKEPPAGLKQVVAQANRERKEIYQVIDDYKKAFQARDLNAIMDLCDAKVVAYDISPPLEYRGKGSYRQAWRAFLDAYDGPIELEIKDPQIGFSGGVAYSICLERYSGKLKSGMRSDLWVRVTDIYHKVDGKWKVIHEHVSVPTDFETGKAMLELKP